jgi:non-ribosomal peptide synthase protein (TIGR01720 family)
MQVVARANQRGMVLTPRQFIQHQTIAELASVSGTAPVARVEQELVTGAVPLSPSQRTFFELEPPDPNHHNQAVLLALRRPLEPRVIRRAIRELLLHHDALRLRFERADGGWVQLNAGPEAAQPPFAMIDLDALPEENRKPALEAVAERAQRAIDISRGPLFWMVLFQYGAGLPNRLLIIFHHLAVDGLSWRLIMGDLYTLCQQLAAGERPLLPAKTTSFKTYVERLCEYARSPALRSELSYWLADPPREMSPLPVENPAGNNMQASDRSLMLALTPEETRALLQDIPSTLGVEIQDLLLTALVQAFESWTGCRAFSYPIDLDLGDDDDPIVQIRSIRDQIRRVPNLGRGYGPLRHLSGDPEVAARLRARPKSEVLFSYWGQFDQVRDEASSHFEAAPESAGPRLDPRLDRGWFFIISLDIWGGQLRVRFRHGDLHRSETMEHLRQRFSAAVSALIAAGRSSGEARSSTSRHDRQQTRESRTLRQEAPDHVVA